MAGIDLSASSVKVVELSRGQKSALRVERYAIEPVERGAIVEGNIEKPEAVAESLTRALRRCGSRAREAALALPTGAVITKKIVLPAGLREEDYELQVETEASQYIPFPIDEVSLDFQTIGPSPDSDDDIDVLLAASRKEKVDDRVAVAEMAGLQPVVMDVEPYAMRAAVDHVTERMPEGGKGRIVAIFAIGQATASLTVVLNRQTIFEREQSFGGQLLTQELVRLYGLSPEEAEARKRSGDLPENYARELLLPFVEQGASDIGRALQFFFTSTPYTRVDQILLAGGSSVVPGFVDAVAQRTQVPTELLNPFVGMELAGSIRERQLRSDAPALLCATGLAMRRFDA
ncbi:MAG: pilus assembly protein PilM [Gammaproteobacteria bacterium]